MKKRKGSLLQRMLAVLLSAVLVFSMVSNAVPASVLAQEGSGAESVSGNDVELAEEETELVEESEPGESVEGTKDTVEKVEDGGIVQEPTEEKITEQAVESIMVMTAENLPGGDCSIEGDGTLTWTFDSANGTLTISGTGKMKNNAGMSGFGCWYDYRNDIKTVVISDAASIGMNAFREFTNLESVTIPDSVQEIGIWAFGNCTSLDNVTIPGSVKIIGFSAFKYCSNLKTLTIEDGADITGSGVFGYCTGLTNVFISGGVKLTEDDTFEYCTNLKSVTIAEGVESIPDRMFWNCTGLEEVIFLGRDMIPTLGDRPWGNSGCPCVTGNNKGLHVPAHMADAYKNAEGWGDYKAYITDGTYTVTVNGGTVSGGTDSASFEEGVTVTITADSPASGKEFEKWEVNSGGVTLTDSQNATTTFTMPAQAVKVTATYQDKDTSIGKGTDWVLDADGKLTIKSDAGMTDWISKRTTYKTQIKSAEIQDGVTSIGTSAFYECGNLTSITVPNSVTSVSSFAFASCSSLTSITIPKDVTSIGNSVFQNCGKLTNVTMAGETPPTIGTSVFYGSGFVKNNAKGIHVPTGKADAYKAAWKDWAAYIEDDTTADTHEHNGVTFTPWTETDSLPTDAGNYYLTEDVTLNVGVSWSPAWSPADGTKLCLNGHTVKPVSQRDVIGVQQSITFSMYDCQKTGMITQAGDTDGSLTYGCGIRNKGTVHMYGGRICGNAQKIGAGVYNDQTGTFYLHDGEISNNKASHSHGGAYNDGVFYMYGGRITGNQAAYGGGLNNYSSNAKLYLYGGEIIGNHATSLYGGIQYSGGTMKIGGALVVKDNTAGSNHSTSNLCLWSNIIELDSERPLESGAYVGITAAAGTPTRDSNKNITGHNKDDYSSYFHSDNSSYVIVNNNNVVQLALPEYDVTVNGGTVSGGTGSASYKAGVTVTITANAPESGKQFDKWVVNSGTVTLANATNSTTTFTMPAEAVEVTAVYKDTDTTPPVIKAGDEVIPTEGTTEYEVDSLLKITVTDDNLASVKYNWTNVKVSGGSSVFSLSAGTYTIVATDKTGNKTTVSIIVREHDYDNSTWGYREADGHARKCKNCDKHNTVIAHTPGPAATEETPQTCTVCGYEISPALGHTHSLALTAAKAATCTEEGNSAYYTCSGCGKYFSDAAGTNAITPDSVKIPALGHDYHTSEWGYKGVDGHAHKCRRAGCGEHDTVVAHTPGAAATEETPQTCTVCGYEISPALGHTHSLALTAAKAATCTEEGNSAYYTCSGCGKYFSDAAGTNAITPDSVKIPVLGHDYHTSEWGYKGVDGHAHQCRRVGCGEHDTIQPHTPGAAATAETPQTCTVCGYIIAPATGINPGTITPEVKPGVNAPATNISTPTEELKDMLLTEEEKQQVQKGTDIRIVLEVQDAGNTVSASDKKAVRQALNGFAAGQYLNIDLYKLVGQDRTDITETTKKIRIVITVPDSLKNKSSRKTRTFAAIRVHDGKAELLTDLDGSADTITIDTDRFSTYAIVYKDTANGGSGGGNKGNDDNDDDDHNGGGNDNGSQNNPDKKDMTPNSAKDSEPKTGDTAPLELYATLSMIAGFAYLLLYFTDRKRGMTEETKKELVSRLVGWAKRGGKVRRYLALAAIFVLLVYYHSIGKKTCAEWKEIYGE